MSRTEMIHELLQELQRRQSAMPDLTPEQLCAEVGKPELAEELARQWLARQQTHHPASTSALDGFNDPTNFAERQTIIPIPDTAMAHVSMDATLQHLGRYQILGEIARGGMGVVYRAVDRMFDRDIAVKVNQAHAAIHVEASRRFLEEAKITGQLQHPGIPAVHEIGTLPDGRQFLAMKLIKGQTLQQMLTSRAADRPEHARFIAIFEQVCQAVAYAHSRGVIHRDLKPQNIMVGTFGEVQVMDWGLAKMIQRSATEQEDSSQGTAAPTQFTDPRANTDSEDTQPGAILGTPAYMSPEQAAGLVEQIDAQADVFGLGAILCCILTGQPPYTGTSSEGIRMAAVMGDLQPAFARLQACGADPEIVALCQRCLAVKKEQRPKDAGTVAVEVAAWGVQSAERARHAEMERQKAELLLKEDRRRRRVWISLAVTLLLGIIASGLLAAWAFRAETQARVNETKAVKAQMQAEADADMANRVKDFLKFDVLLLANPETQARDKRLPYDAEVTLRDVVLRASETIEGKFKDRPLVEAELRWTLGCALQGMGRADLAVVHFKRMLELHQKHRTPDHKDTITSLLCLANSYSELGQYTEAQQLYEKTLELAKAKWGPDHPETLSVINNLAANDSNLGRHAEALKLRVELLSLTTNQRGPQHPDTLRCMHNLAESYLELDRLPEAMKYFKEVLTLQQAMLGSDHPDTLISMHNLALCYYKLGQLNDALKIMINALPLFKTKLGTKHPKTLLSMQTLANIYAALNRHEEALKLREENLKLHKIKYGHDHPFTLECMNNLANSYSDVGRHDEAQALFYTLLEALESRHKMKPGDSKITIMLGAAYSNLGISLADSGKLAEALTWFAKGKALLESVLAKEPHASNARQFLYFIYWSRAETYERLHHFKEADADWSKANELCPDHERTLLKETQTKWYTKRQGSVESTPVPTSGNKPSH